MQGIRHSFRSAFWALILALGLPLVVFLFGTIRHRQLQSTANPRWAQFAKMTGFSKVTAPGSSDVRTDIESNRSPVRTAGTLSDNLSPSDSIRHSTSDTSLTGSVAGRRSLEIPVQSHSVETSGTDRRQPTILRGASERRPNGFHSTVDENDSSMTESTSRLESRVKDVCERLDQLAQQQNKQQSQNVQVQTQLLQREAAIVDALNKLNETTCQFSVVQSTTSESNSNDEGAEGRSRREGWTEHSSADESFQSPIVLSFKPSAEIAPPSPSTRNSPNKESIRISRKIGRDKVTVFTMDVRDADVRQFFSKLSEVARVSILPSPEVTGQISLKVREACFENALKAIIKSRGYVIEREGDIVIIRTADEAIRLKHQNRTLHIKAD